MSMGPAEADMWSATPNGQVVCAAGVLCPDTVWHGGRGGIPKDGSRAVGPIVEPDRLRGHGESSLPQNVEVEVIGPWESADHRGGGP
jgi:hypothetical protein